MTLIARADQVGSLLRPRSVTEAWAAFAKGELDEAARRSIEDDAISLSVRRQEDTGIGAITDGEFRRDVWWSGFIPYVEGIELFEAERSPFADNADEATVAYVPKLVRTAGLLKHPGAAIMGRNYTYIADITNCPVKVTIPAPSRFQFQYCVDAIDEVLYPDRDQFWDDVTAVYKAEIAGLERLGCTFIQIDDPILSFFCDETATEAMRAQGEDPAGLLQEYINATNAAVSDRADSTVVGLHICRGNARSNWAVSGGYAAIAEEVFPRLDVDVFFLEFDDERSGDFEPLQLIPASTSVVLGLVTSKRPELESPDLLKRRIDEASQYADASRLGISPQCGFASILEGNLLTEEDQWTKLRLVSQVAQDYWGS
ncbi:MAG: 5-methyltetrahydropteroyltriglutamate--homocysteine S-methyltransferase [Actinomycetota bacterium]|nr:5-methyltetrahydropteroyltriglutamate--homocysteine S-methyltransferase [Actinomycetota bacterium]